MLEHWQPQIVDPRPHGSKRGSLSGGAATLEPIITPFIPRSLTARSISLSDASTLSSGKLATPTKRSGCGRQIAARR